MRREDKGVERDELRVGLFRGEFLSGNAIKFLRLICNMNISIWVFFLGGGEDKRRETIRRMN